MSYILQHTRIGFCLWDLLALLALLVIVAVVLKRRKDYKDKKKELEDEISALDADKVIPAEAAAEAAGPAANAAPKN